MKTLITPPTNKMDITIIFVKTNFKILTLDCF
jgi:hypothetical protein